jgi:hypothetical protein
MCMTYLLIIITTCVLFSSTGHLIVLSVKRVPFQVLVSRNFSYARSNLRCSLKDLFGASAFHCVRSIIDF